MALTKGIEKKDTEKNSQSQLPKLWPKYIYKKHIIEKREPLQHMVPRHPCVKE